MAAIDNAAYRVFVRERIRPLCEAARALAAGVASMKTDYDSSINNTGSAFQTAANGDTIVENRDAEGVVDLTKLQITQAIGQLDAIRTINSEIIEIPCVRALEAN